MGRIGLRRMDVLFVQMVMRINRAKGRRKLRTVGKAALLTPNMELNAQNPIVNLYRNCRHPLLCPTSSTKEQK
jgi:hypothetical protein